jgi:hypothetical protein
MTYDVIIGGRSAGRFREGYGTTVKSGHFLRADAGQPTKTPV